ncbi:MAG TPA: TRAP transporter substrate-binding protein [Usitatibacter sp.]|nr:TRAP transporter substrate-binding protein [Usitatibacter sp.]
MTSRRQALVLAAAAALTLAAAPGAFAQTEIKIPIKVNIDTQRGQYTKEFGDELAKATHNKYKVTIYPGGQLYDGGKAAKAVQLGNVQMTNEPNSAFTSYTKNVDLMEIPFGFANPEDFQKFLEGPKADVVRKDLEKAGFHVMTFLDEGPFVIGTKSVLIEKPSDFKGLLIRTSGHPVVVDGLKGMGASTAKIPLNEVYSALQQGTITGVYTTFDAFVNEKMVEVAPNVMIIPSYGAYIWVANKQWFESQPKEDQKLMDEIAQKLGARYHKQIWEKTDHFVEEVKKGGGKVSDPAKNPQAIADFRKALAPTYDKMRKQFGKEVIDSILSSQ